MRYQRGKRLSLAALILSLTLLCGCATVKEEAAPSSASSAPVETAATQAEELSVTDLLKAVVTLKGDLEKSLEELVGQEPDAAGRRLTKVAESTNTIRRSLEATIANLGSDLLSVQKQLENIRAILDLVDILNGEILQPAVEMMRENPLDGLSTSEGIRVDVLGLYLAFAEERMPVVETLVAQAQAVDLSIVDSDGSLAEKLDLAIKAVNVYRQDPAILTTLKAMLGLEGDRTYLLAAQNSAEIRASGGFPGAMGVLRIQDGILSVQDFRSVYNVLSSYTPSTAQITSQEISLFHGGLSAPRDADYCPDFERVASIWALGYEERQKEAVDGVISMTPVLVQYLLDVMDEEFTLFDGTTLNGSNACHVLQYDLYYKYYGNEYINGRDVVVDQLFADAAKKTLLLVMDHLDVRSLTGYLQVAEESLGERTMMLWMKEESEQAIIRELGWSGGLNSDPEKPEAGVYVNCTVASKMGIFLEMDTEAGSRTRNEDGSYTYPITVTFLNSITTDEINSASAYITGGTGGTFTGSAYFFAPAGGTISELSSDTWLSTRRETYHDLQLVFLQQLQLSPGKSLTITYEVTTAPGAETELTFSKTPTIQDYR